MKPGGHTFTTDGTVVSLDTNSGLVVGSSTYRLFGPPQPQSVFSIGGATFTARLNGFQVGGEEVTPAGKGVVENGVEISSGTGSVLVVGGATVRLGSAATGTGTETETGVGGGNVNVFEGGAGRVEGRVVVVGIVVVSGVFDFGCEDRMGWNLMLNTTYVPSQLSSEVFSYFEHENFPTLHMRSFA